jgi:hypothetical protein
MWELVDQVFDYDHPEAPLASVNELPPLNFEAPMWDSVDGVFNVLDFDVKSI